MFTKTQYSAKLLLEDIQYVDAYTVAAITTE